MRRAQVVGLLLLVGGTAFGGIGWVLAPNEVVGAAFGFVGLMVLLSGGMLLQSASH